MPIVFSDPRLPGNPIIFANDSFLALTGHERQEVLGQTYHFMMGAKFPAAAEAV
jgi:PAS domain-containing protein